MTGVVSGTERVGPLRNIRVLDLTRVLAGPYATQLLADMGAEVIKIERPGDGDETRLIPPHDQGESHYFMSTNRGKRSVVVDMKAPGGRELILRLAEVCDVVVENFRPGVAARLGLDYASITARNPSIAYCSISAFGQDGPWSGRSAYDIVVQALSGAMSLTGEPDGTPMRSGVPIGDLAGGLFGALGVLAALVDRATTGTGHHADVAMLDSLVGMLGYTASYQFMTGENPRRSGNGHQSIAPYGLFPAIDGHLVVAVLTESFWPKLCRAIDRPDLADMPDYATNVARVQNRVALDSILSGVMSTRPVADWCERLAEEDVPHAPVLTVDQALSLDQVLARGMVGSVPHPTIGSLQSVGPVVKWRGEVNVPIAAAPLMGEATESVLIDLLGCSTEEVAGYVRDGIVATRTHSSGSEGSTPLLEP